jgi:hypothetical protein
VQGLQDGRPIKASGAGGESGGSTEGEDQCVFRNVVSFGCLVRCQVRERERDVGGEEREFFFYYYYNKGNERYSGTLHIGSIVAFAGLRKHLGNLLYDFFCDFLDIFPIHRE